MSLCSIDSATYRGTQLDFGSSGRLNSFSRRKARSRVLPLDSVLQFGEILSLRSEFSLICGAKGQTRFSGTLGSSFTLHWPDMTFSGRCPLCRLCHVKACEAGCGGHFKGSTKALTTLFVLSRVFITLIQQKKILISLDTDEVVHSVCQYGFQTDPGVAAVFARFVVCIVW